MKNLCPRLGYFLRPIKEYKRVIILAGCGWLISGFAYALPGPTDTIPLEVYQDPRTTVGLAPGDSTMQLSVNITTPGTGYLVCSPTTTIGSQASETVDFLGGVATHGGARTYPGTGVSQAALALRGISKSVFSILVCAIWSDETREYLSSTAVLLADFRITPRPAITVPTQPVNLGTCFAGSKSIMAKTFRVQTNWTVVPGFGAITDITQASLSARIISDAITGGSGLRILDENNNDLLKQPALISTSPDGSHLLTAEVPCPAVAGEYNWTVSLLYDIE